IQLLTTDSMHDATVLRQASFGNIEPRHDLYTADNRRGRAGGRRFNFLQHAINTVAHLEAAFERLDMNIRCPRFNGTLHDQINQEDNRRLGSQIAQVYDVFQLVAFTVQTVNNLTHGATATAKQFFDAVFDFRCDTYLRHDVLATGH